jgi:hypothetical protein
MTKKPSHFAVWETSTGGHPAIVSSLARADL